MGRKDPNSVCISTGVLFFNEPEGGKRLASAQSKLWLSEFSCASVSAPSPLEEILLTSSASRHPRTSRKRHTERGDQCVWSPFPASCTVPGETYWYMSFHLILPSQCEQCAFYRRNSSVEQLGHLEGKELGFRLLDLFCPQTRLHAEPKGACEGGVRAAWSQAR